MESSAMWPDDPTTRLQYITERHAELASEAAADRLARSNRPERTYRVSGLKLQFGALLIVIGRSLCDDDTRAFGPAH